MTKLILFAAVLLGASAPAQDRNVYLLALDQPCSPATVYWKPLHGTNAPVKLAVCDTGDGGTNVLLEIGQMPPSPCLLFVAAGTEALDADDQPFLFTTNNFSGMRTNSVRHFHKGSGGAAPGIHRVKLIRKVD